MKVPDNIEKNKYSEKEIEILILYDVMDIIIDSVNNYRSTILGDNDRAQISLQNEDSQKVFIMNILELLSEVALCSGVKNKYIDFLIQIIKNPQFRHNNIKSFKKAVDEFSEWLSVEIVIEKMWLPDINTELDLKIKREDLILISGNSVKHGINRLKFVRGRIKKVLKDNGVFVTKSEATILIRNFQEWLYEDKLNYHITRLSELLNNIKYGIYDYLSLEIENNRNKIFYKSEKKEIEFFYHELIHNTKMAPDFFKKFKTTPLLMKRY